MPSFECLSWILHADVYKLIDFTPPLLGVDSVLSPCGKTEAATNPMSGVRIYPVSYVILFTHSV